MIGTRHHVRALDLLSTINLIISNTTCFKYLQLVYIHDQCSQRLIKFSGVNCQAGIQCHCPLPVMPLTGGLLLSHHRLQPVDL